MDIRRIILTGITLVLTATLVSCMTTEPDPPFTQSTRLLDTQWVLISLNGGDLIEGRAITLRFGETSLEGSGGCNTYGGSYTASEDRLNEEENSLKAQARR